MKPYPFLVLATATSLLLLPPSADAAAATSAEALMAVPGHLSQVSVGDDGSAWGVDAAHHVFHYASGAWGQVPGALAEVEVAAGDDVWGLTPQGGAVRRATGGAWASVGQDLAHLAVGADGDAWGTNAAGHVFHYMAATNSFAKVAGSLDDIAVGDDGAVYGLSAHGGLEWYNPGTKSLQELGTTTGLSHLAVGSDGSVWATHDGTAEYFDVLRNAFVPTSPGFAQLTVGTGASVYGLSTSGELEQWQPSAQAWQPLPAPANGAKAVTWRYVAAGGDGSMWALSASGAPFVLRGQALLPYHRFVAGPGHFDQVSVGIDGTTWAVRSGVVSFFNVVTQSFEQPAGAPKLTQLSVAAHADVWGAYCGTLSPVPCAVYHYEPAAGRWARYSARLEVVQVGADGEVWGLGAEGQVLRYDVAENAFSPVTNFSFLPGSPLPPVKSRDVLGEVTVGADGAVWGINARLQVFRYAPGTESFDQVAGSLAEVSTGGASQVWGINPQQEVYQYQDGALRLVPGPLLIEVESAFDGSVWGVSSAGTAYQKAPGTSIFAKEGAGLTDVLTGNDNAVWASSAQTGSVWHWA